MRQLITSRQGLHIAIFNHDYFEKIERIHSVLRELNNKGHGSYVGVPNKRRSKFFR